MSLNKKPLRGMKSNAKNLTELKPGEAGILQKLDLPEDDAQRLMEMGFVPGHSVTRGLSARVAIREYFEWTDQRLRCVAKPLSA